MGRKWVCIKVPEEIRDEIYEIKRVQNKAAWQIISEAISFYRAMLREKEHYTKSSDTDKIAYYIMKLVTSASYVKFSKNEESLEKFRKVVEQVQKRVNISCDELIPAAEKLIKQPSGRNIHTFNMVLKSCIIKLIFNMLEN